MKGLVTGAATRGVLLIKLFLKISQNSQEKNLCQSLFFNKVAGLGLATLLKKRLAQMFSFEFRKIFKKTFFIEHLWMTASVINYLTIVMMY